jgi:hypothetical protein
VVRQLLRAEMHHPVAALLCGCHLLPWSLQYNHHACDRLRLLWLLLLLTALLRTSHSPSVSLLLASRGDTSQ